MRSPTVHHVLEVCEVVVYMDWVAWSHRDGFSDVVWSAVVARVRHRGSTCSASGFLDGRRSEHPVRCFSGNITVTVTVLIWQTSRVGARPAHARTRSLTSVTS